MPSAAGSSLGTGDISVAFASGSGTLYGGILRDPTGNFERLRTANFSNPAPLDIIGSRPNNDQPFTHAITNGGKDRVYIGNNDFDNTADNSKTATLDVTGNGTVAAPAFTSVRLETRATAGQDGPQIRPVAHADGTVYAAYYGWRSQSGSLGPASETISPRTRVEGAGHSPRSWRTRLPLPKDLSRPRQAGPPTRCPTGPGHLFRVEPFAIEDRGGKQRFRD